ncbi:hypothetical protein [Methanoregula sp.]|uniref:hypothetical protein n=1 Tax=Methanoregula sp. TaxID=2052170 RepID=UPI0035688FC1
MGAGIFVVTEVPGIPEVPIVTGTSRTPGVCTEVGDNGGWDVSVHAETRINAKSNPAKMTGDILQILFIIFDILIKELMLLPKHNPY